MRVECRLNRSCAECIERDEFLSGGFWEHRGARVQVLLLSL